MSRENVETVRAMYAAFNRAGESNDFASYVEAVWDPDCEYVAAEEYEPIRGRDALIRWNERWFEPWEAFHAEVDEVIDAGDAVFSAITVRARGREPLEVTQRLFHVSTVRGDRMLRMMEYTDRAEAREAAGL